MTDVNLDEAAWQIYAPLYAEGWTDDERRSSRIVPSDRQHYRITSAGSDKKFGTYDAPWGAKPRVVDAPGVDIVYEDGRFVQCPPGAVDQRD